MSVSTDRITDEWAQRVKAEYHSAAITQHLTLWLIQMGASPDLIRAGLRVVEDELSHAELSHTVLVAAGGAMTKVLDRDQLRLSRGADQPLEYAVLLACIEFFCLGETVAVPLFSALRSGCTVPEARAALDRILVDEVRHRDFGWTLLEWLLGLPGGDAFRSVAHKELPRLLANQQLSYGDQGGAPMTETELSWGLMHSSRYAAILKRSTSKDFRPRFRALGISMPDLATR